MTKRLDVAKFLEDLTGRYAEPYRQAISEMLVFEAIGNDVARGAALERLRKVMRETLGVAEVLGASMVLQTAGEIAGQKAFAQEPVQKIIPRVTLQEAVEDMVSRTPVTIRAAAERTGQRIAQLYSEGRVVAFARSAEEAVTKRVQDLIHSAIRDGGTEIATSRTIAASVQEVATKTAPWTDAYARQVFRTNVNTAVTAGRFRQAQDDDVREVIPAFRFAAVMDADTRDNHGAMDGVILKVSNPLWAKIAPPLGYNCRCTVELVPITTLRRMGRLDRAGNVIESLVPPTAKPDKGFRHGGRPDLFLGDL